MGRTWIAYDSARDYWAVMQGESFVDMFKSTLVTSRITKLSLTLDVDDVGALQRIGQGHRLSVQHLRLRISLCFFHGSKKDVTAMLWNGADFTNFFNAFPGLLTKLHELDSILVEEVDGDHGMIFAGNLGALDQWLNRGIITSRDPSLQAIPPANGTSPWENLPTELKSQIFELAYFPQLKLKVNSVGMETVHYVKYVHQRPRERYIDKFLVSQAWLTVAWKLLLSVVNFCCDILSLPLLLSDKHRLDHLSWMHGITQMIVDMEIGRIQCLLTPLEHYPTLKLLRLNVRPEFFDSLHPTIGVQPVWRESAFRQCWYRWKVPPDCEVMIRPFWGGSESDQCEEPGEHIDMRNHRTNVETYSRLFEVHRMEGAVKDDEIPETWEEVVNLCSINRKGVVDLFKEVKKERSCQTRD